MRSYGRRFLKRYSEAQAEARIETRDGILWDVLHISRVCRVKIQGSNELVVAQFPENWEETPVWLKPGNAVRVIHRGGARGKIEVVGHGQVIPTPVTGGTFPDIPAGPDCVLVGCVLRECFNNPRMAVFVRTGTYRISGSEYVLDCLAMSATAVFLMGDGGKMGGVAGGVAINSAPSVAGQSRYDLISVGTDGVIDYAAGAIATSEEPTKPSLAVDHVVLGDYVFVHKGMTEVRQFDIGNEWSEPFPALLDTVITDDDLAWAELSTDITVSVFDQLGNPIYQTGGWYITLEFTSGNGTLHSDEEGDSASKIGAHTASNQNSYTFLYTRGQVVGDESPTIRVTLHIERAITDDCYIVLRDAAGDVM